MAIPSASLSNTNLNLLNNLPQALKLSTGQTLSITVTKSEGSQVFFNLAGKAVSAYSQHTFAEGKQLDVKVAQTNPSVILQIQTPATNQSAAKAETAIQTAYRQLLPNQQPINQSILQLVQLTNSNLLPSAIQTQLSGLLDQLFKLNGQLNGKDLKAQLQASGLFFESRIAKEGKPPANDFKGKLFQLLGAIQSSKSEGLTPQSKLGNILAQTLNKVSIQQVQAIENPNILNVELPLQPNHWLDKIAVDIRKNAQVNPTLYEIIIDLTLVKGSLSTKLILQNDAINVSIWADNTTLEKEVSAALPHLKTLFEEANIPLKNLFITKQKPENSPLAQKVALIDIRI